MASSEPDVPPTTRPAAVEGVRRYIAAVRGFSRSTHLFLVVTGFRGLTIFTLTTVLNLYLYSRGYSTALIGILNAVNSVATLMVSVPLGYLADRFGRRTVLVVGGVLYPLSIAAVTLASSTPMLVVTMFLWGVCSTAYWVAGVPLLYGDTRPDQRVQAFSINSFLLYGIGPVGAFLSGEIVEFSAHMLRILASSPDALRYGMWFMVVTGALGAVPTFFLREPAGTNPGEHVAMRAGLRAIAWLFARLLIPDLILAIGLGSILTFIQLYFHLRFRLDPGPVGLVVGSGGIAAGVAALFTPALAARWGNLRTTVRAQAAAVPLMFALAVSMQLWLAIPAYWLVLIFRGTSDPVYTAFVQEQVPDVYRARLTGAYSVTYAIGASLGPAASGALQKIGGFTPAFAMGAACYGVGGLLLYVFFGRTNTVQ